MNYQNYMRKRHRVVENNGMTIFKNKSGPESEKIQESV